nr:MAG: hypothetical protein AM324_07275 [Candidatus Thorarchaeota archaeon SMTZ1-83]
MGALGATALVKMTRPYSEGIIAKYHIQAKSLPLTSDDSFFTGCESAQQHSSLRSGQGASLGKALGPKPWLNIPWHVKH